MKQKMLIFVSLIFLIALLIGINAVSYKQKDKMPDSEIYPNRSTYNSGATGTRAFYDLLSETGRKVSRWQESPANLLSSANKPSTFVIIGDTRINIEENEREQILRWVAEGGKLVIIDRHPPTELLKTTYDWTIRTGESKDYPFGVDPTNQAEMILGTPAIKPSQASIFTRNVNAVQPSRFTTSVETKYGSEKKNDEPVTSITPYTEYDPMPTPTPGNEVKSEKLEDVETTLQQTAPFSHLGNGMDNILVDFPYGAGQIVVLTDPYIVANNGIKLVDNSKLAVNIVASREGLIAFDEFHQGFGKNSSNFFGYFADTPVLPIFAQIFLLIGVLFWSQSQRFARPLPIDEPSRLSKLEYVSAMAELQQRTKAYDLAIENIYSEFRRSVIRVFGMDNTVTRKSLAKAIAERVKLNELDVYNVMRKCEEIIQGERTNKREVVELAGGLREIEEKLGIKRARKHAFRKR